MALTLSTMIELGRDFPHFELKDVMSNTQINTKSFNKEEILVILFLCVHCPYVKLINEKLGEISQKYSLKGVKFIGINSNDIQRYPDDSPENMIKQANDFNFAFPYCLDETQEVARSFDAKCTPDTFIYRNEKLVYRGQFDSARPNNGIEPTGYDISNALDILLNYKNNNENNNITIENQIPSAGCSIKWKVM